MRRDTVLSHKRQQVVLVDRLDGLQVEARVIVDRTKERLKRVSKCLTSVRGRSDVSKTKTQTKVRFLVYRWEAHHSHVECSCSIPCVPGRWPRTRILDLQRRSGRLLVVGRHRCRMRSAAVESLWRLGHR